MLARCDAAPTDTSSHLPPSSARVWVQSVWPDAVAFACTIVSTFSVAGFQSGPARLSPPVAPWLPSSTQPEASIAKSVLTSRLPPPAVTCVCSWLIWPDWLDDADCSEVIDAPCADTVDDRDDTVPLRLVTDCWIVPTDPLSEPTFVSSRAMLPCALVMALAWLLIELSAVPMRVVSDAICPSADWSATARLMMVASLV